MSLKEVLEKITDYDIVDILLDLGSNDPSFVRDGMLFNTVCHNHEEVGKQKLHYYSETKTFHCYTECHHVGNIVELVMKTKECDYYEAYEYVCAKIGVSTSTLKYGFTEEQIDNSFISKFRDKTEEEKEQLIVRDKSVLKRFWSNLFHRCWIDDFITIDVMKKFGIMFDISENRIIIPHYDKDDNLIGIRCRNLNKDAVDAGKKYMPITLNKVLYNYPTSLNLYGMNFHKASIMKYKKALIGESEKFVMQHESYYGEESIAVAINGSYLSDEQIEILQDYGVEEIILALDKEFETKDEEDDYMKKIQEKFVNRLIMYFTVSIIWDSENDLELKMSPTDKGKDVFEKLYKNRIII